MSSWFRRDVACPRLLYRSYRDARRAACIASVVVDGSLGLVEKVMSRRCGLARAIKLETPAARVRKAGSILRCPRAGGALAQLAGRAARRSARGRPPCPPAPTRDRKGPDGRGPRPPQWRCRAYYSKSDRDEMLHQLSREIGRALNCRPGRPHEDSLRRGQISSEPY